MSNWQPPKGDPKIPPSFQRILDSLQTLSGIVQAQIDSDLKKVDRLTQELKRVKNGQP